jgi:hypothetical protein
MGQIRKRASRGRQVKNQLVTMTHEHIAELEKIKEQEGIPKAQLIRLALNDYLKQRKTTKGK